MEFAKIDSLIHVIRGQRVMLDRDLAELYGVPNKALNQAMKRHLNRFPGDFMFKLNPQEAERLRSQSVTANLSLSSVLNSEHAVEINIAIMRAFVKLRHALTIDASLAVRMEKAELALEGLEAEQGEQAVAIHEVLAAFRRLTGGKE